MKAIRICRLASFCLVGFSGRTAAQIATIDAGPVRFVVLVDRSGSMKSERFGPKVLNLEHAKAELLRALLLGGKSALGIPRFRPGRDVVTAGRFGIDQGGESSKAYLRLDRARLDDDYLHISYPASRHPTYDGLAKAIDPGPGPELRNLNVLAWAVPMAFARMPPPTDDTTQMTYLVMLNDAQMNEGSIVLENQNLGSVFKST